MKVYVLIPHYNNWELTHRRLNELYKYCNDDIYKVIVIDDCSVDDMTEGGIRWWTRFPRHQLRVESIQTPENLNFLLASNFGINATVSNCADEDVIILLSNDVEIRTNFVKQAVGLLSEPKKIVGGVLYLHDTGWNKFGDRIFKYLEGWLLAFRAGDWKLIGGFDERFSPSDYEDIDFSTKSLELGYELVPLNNPGLHHLGGQSIKYGDERLERTNRNKKKFEDKWTEK